LFVAWGASSVSLSGATQLTTQSTAALEVRLAETQPAAGLIEASLSGSSEKVYLHREVVVTNADVVQAQVVPGNASSAFNVTVAFSSEGAAKMAQATASHLNRPLAILINGQVVAAPTLRGQVTNTAVITGDFTNSEATAIAAGLNLK
jgi:preprotein translocase subunit SecD